MIPRVVRLPLREKLDRNKVVTETGCWEWPGVVNRKGYGMAWCRDQQRPVLCHRAAYRLWVGDIPGGLLVCHTCDNRRCFNPDHLFLGTFSDNMRDALAKGRLHTNHPKVRKLSSESAVLIKSLIGQGVGVTELARRFNISTSSIRAIRDGRTFKDVLSV